VNGKTALLGQKADPEVDEITVDGRPLALEGQKRYLMLNKPRGYVCTLSDEKGRKTVAELVRDCGARVYPAGRLDLGAAGHAPTSRATRPAGAAVAAALERSGIVCVASQAESGKLCAPWLSMGTLAQLADFVLVEADGAKRLPLKAHASHEPVIPEEAQRVIMVIGIDGVGKTIRETCHRSALYAQLAGVDEETVVTPQLAARIVNAEGYGDRVYINKVESAADYEAAQAMANEFSCPVIAGSLHQGVYVCLH